MSPWAGTVLLGDEPSQTADQLGGDVPDQGQSTRSKDRGLKTQPLNQDRQGADGVGLRSKLEDLEVLHQRKEAVPGEPEVIVRRVMDWKDEARRQEQDAAVSQHAEHFMQSGPGLDQVLEHFRAHDKIERGVRKRQPMGVGNQRYVADVANIDRNNISKPLTVRASPAADVERPGPAYVRMKASSSTRVIFRVSGFIAKSN